MGPDGSAAHDPWPLDFPGDGSGRPWGDGTFLASRQASGAPPGTEGNLIRPLIGGFEYARALREALEAAIDAAGRSSCPPDDRGHVYLAGGRLDPLRDLSEDNPRGTGPWRMPRPGERVHDETGLGLLLRAVQAGLRVRVLLWEPVALDRT